MDMTKSNIIILAILPDTMSRASEHRRRESRGIKGGCTLRMGVLTKRGMGVGIATLKSK
jgi:hypothetical protein